MSGPESITPIFAPFWGRLCAVDPASIDAIAAWLAEADRAWQRQPREDKPQRIHWNSKDQSGLPMGIVGPVVQQVISEVFLPIITYDGLMLSRMEPGQQHGMHVDTQNDNGWLTRVHVPIITNPGAWIMFEDDLNPRYNCPMRVHFEAGVAYSFNALERHSFGNDGTTDRVHLIFDLYRGR